MGFFYLSELIKKRRNELKLQFIQENKFMMEYVFDNLVFYSQGTLPDPF